MIQEFQTVLEFIRRLILVFSKWMIRVALILSVLFVLIGVFFRYMLNNALAWPSELSIQLFVLMVFFAIPISLDKDNQPRLEILVRLIPRLENFFGGLSQGVIGTYLLTLFITWFSLIPGEKAQLDPSLGISTLIPSLVLPTGTCLAVVIVLMQIIKHIMKDSKSKILYLMGTVLGILGTLFLTISFTTSISSLSFVIVIILIMLGIPIAVALGVGAMAMVVSTGTATINIITQNVLQGANSFVLLAIPFFVLTGALVAETSLGTRLVNFCKAWVGWLPGGLGVADVLASAMFANMSGSAIADTAAIGSVMIPALVDAGYEAESAVALQASAGVIGVVFPPATALILFGFASETSIIGIFQAAIIPGILIVIGLALTNIYMSYRSKVYKSAVVPFNLTYARNSTVKAIPSLCIPVILLGGILSGVFTPSEAGAVATFVALVIVGFQRDIGFKSIEKILDMATDNLSIVMFVLINATAIGWAFTATELGSALQSFISRMTSNPLLTLILINLVLLLIHFFIETGPSILVMVPLLMPLINNVGINPLQFAAMTVVNSTIGQVVPPVGVNLFIASKIGNVSVMRAVPYIVPYVISSLIVLALVTLIPGLSIWLPGNP